MRKIIITGPTGAIGTALVGVCISHGIQVTAVCRPGSQRIGALPESNLLCTVKCSLEDMDKLPDLVRDRDYDTFFHLGWTGTFGGCRNDLTKQVQNIQYTLNAVKTAYILGCTKFVGAGSQAEYGRKKEALKTDTSVCPENGYGMAKLCAGQMSKVLCEQMGMEHVWARVLSVYGPNDGRHVMVMSVIDQLLHGKEPAVSKGEQVWDYLYSEDAAKAFYLIGEKGVHGKAYPVGSGSARPLRQYMEIIRDAIDPGLSLGIGKRPYACKQVMHLCADISELAKDTGFEPEHSFETGIRQTIAWCREN